MELKYPKITMGLKFIFCGILAGVPMLLLIHVLVSVEFYMFGSTYSGIARYVSLLVPSVLIAVGLWFAGKEEKQFRKAFVCSLIETVLVVSYMIVPFFAGDMVLKVLQLAECVAAIVQTGFLCSAMAELLWKNEKTRLSKLGNLVFGCQAVCCIESILLQLIPDFLNGGFVLPFLLAGILCATAGGVAGLVLFWSSIKFFSQQKEEPVCGGQVEETLKEPAEVPQRKRKKGAILGVTTVAGLLVLLAVGISCYDELVQLYATNCYSRIEAFSKEMLQECEKGETRSYGPWEATCYPDSDIVQFHVRSNESADAVYYYGFYYSAYNKHKKIQEKVSYRHETLEELDDLAIWADTWSDSIGSSERIHWRLFWYEIKEKKE